MSLVWQVSRKNCVTLDGRSNTGFEGFNYAFNSLTPQGKHNELNQAFQVIFSVPSRFTIMMLLKNLFPILHLLVRFASLLIIHTL